MLTSFFKRRTERIGLEIGLSEHKISQLYKLFSGDLHAFSQLIQTTQTLFHDKEVYSRQYFRDILRHSPEFQESRARFRYKLNRIWNSKFTAELLDSNPDLLRYKIISAFNEITYRPTGYTLNIGLENFRGLLEDPVIKAMFDEGLLINLSFESALRFRQATDFFHALDYVAEQRAGMSWAERVHFRVWQFRHGFYFNRHERKRLNNVRDKEVLEPKQATDLELVLLWDESDFKEDMQRADHDELRKMQIPFWERWLESKEPTKPQDKK